MTRYGSDVVVELLRQAGVEQVALNPGATFRGIHDSLAHSDGPRIILCTHESVAVSLAHGYAKAAGRPMAVLLHDVVGLQNASMAIYNAWCDRVPIFLIGGTGPMSKPQRRPWIDWIHTALVQGQQVRDYVKWDDQPADLASVPESFARAWTTMLAEPQGPVYLCLDAALQEEETPRGFAWPPLDSYSVPSPPAPPADALATVADALAQARLPVLVSDYAGATRAGFDRLRELAELLAAPVLDGGRRFCFPTEHELNFTGLEGVLSEADVVVALDVEDPSGMLAPVPQDARVFNLGPAHLKLRSWAHDYQQLRPVELHLTTTCDMALPALVEACAPDASLLAARRAALTGRVEAARSAWRAEAATAASEGAVHPARLALELERGLEGRRWTLVHGTLVGWERRLWSFERFSQHCGWHGGGGLGYGPGASIGAALAIGSGDICLNVQPDGDLLYSPAALWTAARYRVPVLTVMHNNRQYQNTVEHAAQIGRDRRGSVDHRHVGAALDDPPVDFAALARSLGMWASGPVTAPGDVRAQMRRAIEVVQSGAPALVDVVTAGA